MWRVIFLSLLLSGCAGTMQGVTENGDPIKVEWTDNLDGGGSLTLTYQNEVFKGRHTQGQTSGVGFAGTQVFHTTASNGISQALLVGNKGSSMECKFVLSTPDLGMPGGGVGTCKTNLGQRLSLTF